VSQELIDVNKISPVVMQAGGVLVHIFFDGKDGTPPAITIDTSGSLTVQPKGFAILVDGEALYVPPEDDEEASEAPTAHEAPTSRP
jgi:hypothetical protein